MIRAFILAMLAVSAVAQEFEYGIGQTEQVTRGLVSYWSMRNSGTTVFDERGGNNGGASNGVGFAYDNGVVGQGGSLDGSNDYVNAGLGANLDMGSSSFSVAFWVNPRVTDNGYIINKKDEAGDANAGFMVRGTIRPTARIADGVAFKTSTSDGALWATNVWQHVVVVFNRSTKLMSRYYNGSVTGTEDSIAAISNTVNSTKPLLLGARTAGAAINNFYFGNIDEVRIYNRVLSSDEIKQLYRMGATIYQNR